jgi:pimeloyl-ACP methyl ester carboxylesterase
MAELEFTLPDGRVLAYAEYGDSDGVPVVFHHGTPGSRLLATLLDAQASEAGIRVIAPDRPGFGRSDPDPDRRIEDWSRDVSALMDALSVRQFGVLGFSGGGPFALACAATCPRAGSLGLVSALVPGADGGVFGSLACRMPSLLWLLFQLSAGIARLSPNMVSTRTCFAQHRLI